MLRSVASLSVLLVAACSSSVPEGEAESGATTATSTSTGGPTSPATTTSGVTTSAGDGTDTAGAATTDTTGDTTPGDTTTSDTTTGGTSTGGPSTSTGGDPALPPDCPRVQVTVMPGNTLNVRPTPSVAGEPVGALDNGAIVDAVALVHGEVVEGSDLWFEIQSEDLAGFVLAAYVQCTTEEPPVLDPPEAFWLPLECGKQAKISQGNFGDFSHQGKAAYAFDFAIPLGTPLVAMADGVVIHTYTQTMPGDPCYNGGGADCFPYANLVVLLHGDGSTTLYKHLNAVLVSDGEFVPRADVVGLSGSTGYSTGPHAHTMRMQDCGTSNCQSLPLAFADVPGDGVPNTDEFVTSKNCP